MEIRIDARSIARASREIRRAAPAAWKALRVELRAVGRVVADDAKQDVQSWSGKGHYGPRGHVRSGAGIASSIKVRVTAGGNVKVVMGGDAAPEAVPIENQGKGFVRHPVFGNREVWTSKNSHPAILLPAFARHSEWALERMEQAYLDTFIRVFERGS